MRTLEHYLAEIEDYETASEPWRKICKDIKRRYMDKRDEAKKRDRTSKYNVLWSNVQTLKPAIYSRDPVVQVLRRFKDKDPVGREASEVLERAIEFEKDTHPFGDIMKQCVLDRLLGGRGTAWVRYVPHFLATAEADADEPVTAGAEAVDVEGEKGAPLAADESSSITDDTDSELDYEEVISDYVHLDDFGHNKARTWEEVHLVWRIAYMTKAKLDARFPVRDRKGPDKTIPLDYSPGSDAKRKHQVEKKAAVYEIWDKETKEVIWLTKSYPEILDRRKDPLKLQDFFPCPKPILATLDNDSLIPAPDYWEYGDQAQQLDELTMRITLLTRAIKVVGAYDSGTPALGRLLNEGTENKLVPVDSWAMFAEKGGMKGAMELVPLLDLARTLEVLIASREKVKQDLYEITGLSDIIRGSTEASETATAQQIKGRFATLRLSELQGDVQRFARDLIRIMGEVIGNFFDAETLSKISGKQYLPDQATKQAMQQALQQFQQAQQQYEQMAKQAQQQPGMPAPQPPPPPQPPNIPEDQIALLDLPTWEDITGLLNSKINRTFRIEIETDSTISMDEDQDKQDRTELLTTMGEFFASVLPVKNMDPNIAPVISEMLSFAVRAFPAGRGLEQAVEKYAEELANPKPQQNTPPEVQVEQMKQQTEQMKAQTQREAGQIEMQKAEMSLQSEREKSQQRQQEMNQQQALAREKFAMDRQTHSMKMEQMAAQNALQQTRNAAPMPREAANG